MGHVTQALTQTVTELFSAMVVVRQRVRSQNGRVIIVIGLGEWKAGGGEAASDGCPLRLCADL